jgi:GTP-binding protein
MSNKKINFNQARFLLSAASLSQLPKDEGAEVAFIGRSNAGKSSALNTLCNQNNLAKTSRTPGRTQLINIFNLDNTNTHRLIDLPGYGYAKVPEQIKKNWQELLDKYLRTRKSLKALIIVMDIRHPLQDLDWQFLYWTEECNINTHIILTKADKFKYGKQKTALLSTAKSIEELTNQTSVQLFSSQTRLGVEELEQRVAEFFLC